MDFPFNVILSVLGFVCFCSHFCVWGPHPVELEGYSFLDAQEWPLTVFEGLYVVPGLAIFKTCTSNPPSAFHNFAVFHYLCFNIFIFHYIYAVILSKLPFFSSLRTLQRNIKLEWALNISSPNYFYYYIIMCLFNKRKNMDKILF